MDDRLIIDGFLYVKDNITKDVISGKYKMLVKKYWKEIYSRKRQDIQFGYGYRNLHVFISDEIQFLKTENPLDFEAQFNKIHKHWDIILEYAIDKINPDLIECFESDRYTGDSDDLLLTCGRLGIEKLQYLGLNQISPYS